MRVVQCWKDRCVKLCVVVVCVIIVFIHGMKMSRSFHKQLISTIIYLGYLLIYFINYCFPFIQTQCIHQLLATYSSSPMDILHVIS